MSIVIYDHGKLELLDRTINWVSDTIKAMLVTSSYIPVASHTFVDSGAGGANPLTNEVSGAGYARMTLGTKVIDLDAVNHRVRWKADNILWTAVNGFTAAAILIFKSTGVDTTSRLIAYIDSGGYPKTANGSDLAQIWSADGVLSDV